jgi:membrane-associated phospholipid phosphatase
MNWQARISWGLIYCLLAAVPALRAQDKAPDSELSLPVAQNQAPLATHATSDPVISWKTIGPRILHDQKTVFLFPLQLAHGRHWVPTAAVVVSTAGLVLLDPSDTPYFRRTSTFNGFNSGFGGAETAAEMAIVPSTLYLVGLWRKDSYAQQTALLAGEAATDTQILSVVMKDITRRVRPSDIAPHAEFDDTWFQSKGSPILSKGSFPSGHATTAFAIAAVLSNRYRNHRWVPWVAYGFAGVIGFSRISLQSHFPSDVFIGAALGYAIGKYAVLGNH